LHNIHAQNYIIYFLLNYTQYIVEQLLERGESVRVFDLRVGFQDARVQFFVGSICSADDLRPALTGVTTVYNTVSPPHGISGVGG
jgi:hypothetical protein